MTDKQLYTVTLSDTLVVLAKDEAAARRIAYDKRRDADVDIDEVSEMRDWPPNWEGDSIPFGADETIDALIASGHAPHMGEGPE